MAERREAAPQADKAERARVRRRAVGLVLMAGVALALAAMLFARVPVCDEAVTQAGEVVQVCRHLQVTDPPVLAAGIVVAIGLALYFDLNEIVLLGFSVKRNLDDAEAAAKSAEHAFREAQAAAASATLAQAGARESAVNAQQAEAGAQVASVEAADARTGAKAAAASSEEAARHARGAERSAAYTEELVRSMSSPDRVTPGSLASHVDVDGEMQRLARAYNDVRERKQRGNERTEDMTGVVGDMIALFSAAGPLTNGAPAMWLRSDDRGERLAAYAYFHTHPDVAIPEALARSATSEDKPFGQYWALRALRRHIETNPSALDRNTIRTLERLLRDLGASTDRGYEIGEILRVAQY